MPHKIAAGNWKMNGMRGDLKHLKDIAKAARDVDCITVICPPVTMLRSAVNQTHDALNIGAQDCHVELKGAFTGDISAPMLADAGADYVIVGHSERRNGHGENNALVRAKAEQVLAAGMTPILCIGESLAVREAGDAVAVVSEQLKSSLPADSGIVVAYEPIWAIGTGLVPSVEQIAQMHDALRALLQDVFPETGARVTLLYGGSVKASNADDIFSVANVDGALVGGASLTADDFVPIMQALDRSAP